MDWYYARNNDRIGPVEEGELVRLLTAGEIDGRTLVWKAGMAEWAEVRSLSEFASLAPNSLAPAMGPQMVVCAVSGRQVPIDQAVRIGQDYVSAEYKATYIQRTREGLQPTRGVTHMRYAGFWIRALAWVIDYIIVTVGGFAIFFVLGLFMRTNLFSDNTDIAFTLLAQIAQLVLAIGYYVGFVGAVGATPGKMVCSLQIVRADGRKITYGRAFGRYLSTILSALILCIGYIIAGFDDQKRALHDYICDTRVAYK